MTVYPDGRVCISILHPPGEDEMSGEDASERWLPTQSVSSVLLSVLSLLADPNTSSPANVDASVCYVVAAFLVTFAGGMAQKSSNV